MQDFQTPEWVKDAVFYQIFPDRFAKSDRVTKPSNLEPWDAPPTLYGFKGGDLIGVVEKLDYLQDLGFTAIYFCPIFQSTANHRYHTHDYKSVDPLLGGNEAFRVLLDEAHRRGIRVVIDGVFNHASRGFFQFNHILENGPKSPYLDWFTVHGWPLNPYDEKRPPNYEAWWNLHGLPKLNTRNPQVREMIWTVAQRWVEFGIDGWRLDVPGEINDDSFWQEFRRRVKGANPDAYIVGEIWDPAQRWLRGDQFDAVMNYLFFRGALSFCGQHSLHPALRHRWHHWTLEPMGGEALMHWIDSILALYPRAVNEVQLNLLDSHDTPRFLTMVQGDEGALRLAILFQMTYPGAPCLYYGDEIGIGKEPLPQPWDPADDPMCRPGMPWNPEHWNESLRQHVKRAIALRHAHPVLRRGDYRSLGGDATLYVFERRLGDEQMIVALNAAREARTVGFPAPAGLRDGQTLVDVWGGGQARVAGGAIRDLHLPPQSGAVLMVPPGQQPGGE
jgi:neopullulanase